MLTNIKQLTPAKAIHPGEILNDELKDRGISQQDFSLQTGIAKTILNEIIKGKRSINADLALLIGKALNMDAILWMNLQNNYDLDLANIKQKTQTHLEALDQWNMIKNFIPSKYFKKREVITGNPILDIPIIHNIYGVTNADALIGIYSKSSYAHFRKSEKLEIDKINLIGWVKLVNYDAKKINIVPFDSSKKEELLAELKVIFRNNKNTVELTKTTLAKYGIKFIEMPNPDKCAVDGVSFWSNGNPAIGLSIRHKRIDNFAFTVLHELGHIFLHLVNNNNAEFIDLDKDSPYSNTKEEKEANNFSSDVLIDASKWKRFLASNLINDEFLVADFANELGVHPAIIYGRYSKETGNYKIKTTVDKKLN